MSCCLFDSCSFRDFRSWHQPCFERGRAPVFHLSLIRGTGLTVAGCRWWCGSCWAGVVGRTAAVTVVGDGGGGGVVEIVVVVVVVLPFRDINPRLVRIIVRDDNICPTAFR